LPPGTHLHGEEAVIYESIHRSFDSCLFPQTDDRAIEGLEFGRAPIHDIPLDGGRDLGWYAVHYRHYPAPGILRQGDLARPGYAVYLGSDLFIDILSLILSRPQIVEKGGTLILTVHCD